jgi:hypothetical protein
VLFKAFANSIARCLLIVQILTLPKITFAQNKMNFQLKVAHMKLSTDLGLGQPSSAVMICYHEFRDATELFTCPNNSFVLDSVSNQIYDTSAVLIKQKSPLVAVLLSATIPGGGQIYNGSYWKVPIIYGLQAFFVSQWISNNKTYQSLRSQYSDSLRTGSNSGYLDQLQQYRDSYHDQRDSYAWYIAGVYLLSIIDAYVDAELSGFDVSSSLGFAPNGSAVAAISFKVKF